MATEQAGYTLPTTLPYFIFEKIRSGIITGKYPPGSVLREQQLEQEFGSSRGPIRESLRLLAQNHLVEHAPRRGFRVRPYTSQDLVNMYKLRATLETIVVDSLSDIPVEPLVEDLRACLKRMKALSDNKEIKEYFDENLHFHQIMYDYTDNEPLKITLLILNEMSLPFRYLVISKKFDENRSLHYHMGITGSIAQGDFEKAKFLTETHILQNLTAVQELYAKYCGDPDV